MTVDRVAAFVAVLSVVLFSILMGVTAGHAYTDPQPVVMTR